MSSYPITDEERNRLLSHSRITVALALAAADAENEDQIKGVGLALHRIAGEILNASWGFDSKAFVAEVERMAQAEIDRQKSMAEFGRTVSKILVAEGEAEAAKGDNA